MIAYKNKNQNILLNENIDNKKIFFYNNKKLENKIKELKTTLKIKREFLQENERITNHKKNKTVNLSQSQKSNKEIYNFQVINSKEDNLINSPNLKEQNNYSLSPIKRLNFNFKEETNFNLSPNNKNKFLSSRRNSNTYSAYKSSSDIFYISENKYKNKFNVIEVKSPEEQKAEKFCQKVFDKTLLPILNIKKDNKNTKLIYNEDKERKKFKNKSYINKQISDIKQKVHFMKGVIDYMFPKVMTNKAKSINDNKINFNNQANILNEEETSFYRTSRKHLTLKQKQISN